MAMANSGVTLYVQADVANSIVGSNIADNTVTATDLQVDFTAATNENSVFTYRVIAVKASAAGAFTLAAADLDKNALDGLEVYTVENGINKNTPSEMVGSNIEAVIMTMGGQLIEELTITDATTNVGVSSLS
ncbi:MAG: hypothetical protein P8P87_09220 [Crocinitomicaceae bacterium]|nr:hypothetical protein [Crocinitomicaceae bacterium]